MRDEDWTYDGSDEDIYSSDSDSESLDEMEPEMQGFMAGWKRAGRYDKKEKHIKEESENFE